MIQTSSAPGVTHRANPKYRTDIDGLRAVAVLLVVLDHFRFQRFSGGYIGVDVFFVISGYLIGSSLITEFRAGRFSLATFYERRVRRIMPALLAMLIVVSVVAGFYLLPSAFTSYARSAIAAALSYSNFLFWSETGYFDAPSLAKPLLHTWSLGVEEQFYVLFPILLYGIFRWRPKILKAVLWFVVILTLALSEYVVRRDATVAFFWSPLRAWELLAGVLVSQYGFTWLQRWAWREIAVWTGLLLILVPAMSYTALTRFPGLTAVAPCLGAALVLAAGQVGFSGGAALLSVPPMRFIGLISYSLYLWHWPLLAFQVTSSAFSIQSSLDGTLRWALLALSLVLGAASWRFVETPFRSGRLRLARRPLMTLAGTTIAVIVFSSVFVIRSNGLSGRLSGNINNASIKNMNDAMRIDLHPSWRHDVCFLMPEYPFKDFQPDTCLGRVAGQRNYLLYGDSTGASLYPGLKKIFPEIHVLQATTAGCPPFGEATAPTFRENCTSLWHYIHDRWLPQHPPDAVILAAVVDPAHWPAFGEEIARWKALGIPVIVTGRPISFTEPIIPVLLTSVRIHNPRVRSDFLSQHIDPNARREDELLRSLARNKWHVRFISYFDQMCRTPHAGSTQNGFETSDGCALATNQGEPLFLDQLHLSPLGSDWMAESIRRNNLLP